jgi:hypothetical protein
MKAPFKKYTKNANKNDLIYYSFLKGYHGILIRPLFIHYD